MCGNAAFQCVKKVIERAMAGEVDATVTNALNKEAMNLAGHHFNGHTEIYAHSVSYTHLDVYKRQPGIKYNAVVSDCISQFFNRKYYFLC